MQGMYREKVGCEELIRGNMKVKKRKKKKTINLTPRQREAYVLIHQRTMTLEQAGMQMGCSKQNVSQLLIIAEQKVKAGSRR